MDLGATIEPKSTQLNADDLIMGPLTIMITKVTGGETKEQPVKVFFAGDSGKPYLPCKTARRVLVQVWGRDGASYVGRSMTLYRDPDVKFGGIAVGGIRISHMSDIANDITLVLTASKTSRKPFTVKPLRTEPNTPVDPAIKAAGDEAAKGGVDVYTAWLATLTPEVKATVKWLHKEWSRVAKAVVVPDPDGIDFDEAATASVEVNPDNVAPGTLDRPADKDPDEPATPQPQSEVETVTASDSPDVVEPRSEESQLADLQLAISERRSEMGDEAYETVLNGRSTRSMDQKAAAALLKELNK